MIGEVLIAVILFQAPVSQNCPPMTDPAQILDSRNERVITGKVLLPSNRTFEGIQVVVLLQTPTGVPIQTTSTDMQGNFTFRCVGQGAYEFVIKADGYKEVHQQVGGTIRLQEQDRISVTPDSELAADFVDAGEQARKYPKRAVEDYDKALDEIKKGNPDKAAKLLFSLLKIAPDFYDAHNTLGTVYQKLRLYNDSEAQYQTARQLNPRAVEPLINLGSLFIEEADLPMKNSGDSVILLGNARTRLEESLKLKPSSLGYYFLGMAYYKTGSYDEAEPSLQRALEMTPHPPGVHLMLANVYMKLQKWPNALEHLDAYLLENPRAADRSEIQNTRTKVIQLLK